MDIKPIDATAGADLVRAASSRLSQRASARMPDATVGENALAENAQDKPPPAATAPSMRIDVDQDTGKTVVSLLNPESGEILRQMPSKAALEIAKAIGRFQGLFVNLKV
jgi:flagellar protein FlaG